MAQLIKSIQIKIPKEVQKRCKNVRKSTDRKILKSFDKKAISLICNKKFINFNDIKFLLMYYKKNKNNKNIKYAGGIAFCKRLEKICK